MTMAMKPAEQLTWAADHVRDGRWITGLPVDTFLPIEAWLRRAAVEYTSREGLPKLGDPNPGLAPVDLTGAPGMGPTYWTLALDLAQSVNASVAARHPFHRPRPQPFRSLFDERIDALATWFAQQVRDDLSRDGVRSGEAADLSAKLEIVEEYWRSTADQREISDKVVARIRHGQGNPGMPASMAGHDERIEFDRAAEVLRMERHTLFTVLARLAAAYDQRDGYQPEWRLRS